MSKIIEAITSINSNAKVVVTETIPNDVDTCTIEWLQGTTKISKTDIKAKITELKNELINATAKKETDKASANTKLKALGLTDDEIKAIKGI
tara:strand:- start:107 stop:382 length:276 start_codon:yes stop_codon:yes gene_type:complete